MVEELVELLVGVVDAELLERVGLEVFEAEDVENADERSDIFA